MSETRYKEKNIETVRPSEKKESSGVRIKITKTISKSTENLIDFLVNEEGMKYEYKDGNILLEGENYSVIIRDNQVFITGDPSFDELYKLYKKCTEEEIPTINFEDRLASETVNLIEKAIKNNDLDSLENYMDILDELHPSEEVLDELKKISKTVKKTGYFFEFLMFIQDYDSPVIEHLRSDLIKEVNPDFVNKLARKCLEENDKKMFESIVNGLEYLSNNGFIGWQTTQECFFELGKTLASFYADHGYFPVNEVDIEDDDARESFLNGIVSTFQDRVLTGTQINSDVDYCRGMVLFLKVYDNNPINEDLYDEYLLEEHPSTEDVEEHVPTGVTEGMVQTQNSFEHESQMKKGVPKPEAVIVTSPTYDTQNSLTCEFDAQAKYIVYSLKTEEESPQELYQQLSRNESTDEEVETSPGDQESGFNIDDLLRHLQPDESTESEEQQGTIDIDEDFLDSISDILSHHHDESTESEEQQGTTPLDEINIGSILQESSQLSQRSQTIRPAEKSKIILTPYNIYKRENRTEEIGMFEQEETDTFEQEETPYLETKTENVDIGYDTQLHINVYDLTGRRVDAKISYTVENGKAHIKVRLPDDSPTGTYFVIVSFEQDGKLYKGMYKKILVK